MRHYVPQDMNPDKRPEEVRKLEICVHCGVPRKDWVRGGGCQLDDAKKWGAHYTETLRPREDIIAESEDPDPTIKNDEDAKRFSELTNKLRRLEMEKQAVQKEIDKIQGTETSPGPLLSILSKHGKHSSTYTTFETFVVHDNLRWMLSGVIRSKIDDALAVKLLNLSKTAVKHKQGSAERNSAFQGFKETVGVTTLTDKQLWTELETTAMMCDCKIVVTREVIDRDVWNTLERDKDFKFPSVLKRAKVEKRDFEITHSVLVDDVGKRDKL